MLYSDSRRRRRSSIGIVICNDFPRAILSANHFHFNFNRNCIWYVGYMQAYKTKKSVQDEKITTAFKTFQRVYHYTVAYSIS